VIESARGDQGERGLLRIERFLAGAGDWLKTLVQSLIQSFAGMVRLLRQDRL